MSVTPDDTHARACDARPGWLAAALIAAASALLLLGATALSIRDVDYAESGFRRFRTDQAAAVASYLRQRYPESLPGLGGAPWDPDLDQYYHSVLGNQVRVEGIRPWQAWRRVRERPFLRARGPDRVPWYDDPGRARLLELGFGLLRGISPFLIFWLGPLAMALVLAWFVWESARAARLVAGSLFALLVAASPYVVESLALPRSAVGFQLVALVLLLALALPALRARAPGWPGWLARLACAGLALAVCVLCRSGVLSMLPAFLALLVVGSLRAGSPADPRRRRVAGLLAGALLLLGPYLLLRPAQRHEIWAGLWEGLGDYDRTKGHAWSDRAAAERVWQAQGRAGELRRMGGDALVAWLSRPEASAVLRREVLEHIRGDPAWYAGILARRALATISLQRLWPWTPRDGYGRSSVETQGGSSLIDKYWGFTATADRLGVSALQLELPVSLLLAPLVLLVGLGLWRPAWPRDDAPWGVLGLLALAALAAPVLVTTASGTEPQAIVLVYYLSFGYLVERAFTARSACQRWRRWWAARIRNEASRL